MELRLLVGTIDATGRGVAGGPGVALGPRMAVRQEPASQALVALTREAAVCRVLRGLVRVLPVGRSARPMTYVRTVSAMEYAKWLTTAVEEARAGLAEGGVPVGAALYGADGALLGRGRNRRVQDGDPSAHAETAAFRAAGRQRSYRGTTMVTTLSPCWYCSGLVRQFGISRVVIGEAETFHGGHDWLAEHGVEIVLLNDTGCKGLMHDFIRANPELWSEDIGD